jgi:hypothetical protein
VPVFQFTFFTDDGPDVYVVPDAMTWLEATEAVWRERAAELLQLPNNDVEIKELTTNSMILVEDQLLRVEGE